ncbi:MAG: methyltransferase domain-containing protein [Candidatus Woesearchaeota archaeon]
MKEKIRMSLHLGCGNIYNESKGKEKWINLDKMRTVKADVYHDLDEYPYPFAPNTFDYIYSQGLLEHVEDVIKHLEEIWRISKKGAIVEYKVPHSMSQNSFTDFTHKHTFTEYSMALVCDNLEGNLYIQGKFDLLEVQKIKGQMGKLFPEFINRKICHVIEEVYQFIIFKLVVKK